MSLKSRIEGDVLIGVTPVARELKGSFQSTLIANTTPELFREIFVVELHYYKLETDNSTYSRKISFFVLRLYT